MPVTLSFICFSATVTKTNQSTRVDLLNFSDISLLIAPSHPLYAINYYLVRISQSASGNHRTDNGLSHVDALIAEYIFLDGLSGAIYSELSPFKSENGILVEARMPSLLIIRVQLLERQKGDDLSNSCQYYSTLCCILPQLVSFQPARPVSFAQLSCHAVYYERYDAHKVNYKSLYATEINPCGSEMLLQQMLLQHFTKLVDNKLHTVKMILSQFRKPLETADNSRIHIPCPLQLPVLTLAITDCTTQAAVH